MKKLLTILSLVAALHAGAADTYLTNLTRAATVQATDLVLVVTNNVNTRLVPVSAVRGMPLLSGLATNSVLYNPTFYKTDGSPIYSGGHLTLDGNLTLAGLLTGNAAGATNTPFANLNFAGLVEGNFTSVVCGYLKFTNGGKTYSIVVSTNLP